MKLVLYLGVQCSFTQIDCYDLKKLDIDWNSGELHKQRQKEDMPRLAVISPFVLQMLKDYMEQNDNTSEYIFVEKGKRITPAAIGKAFDKIRQKADVTPTLKYLRKTALTTAGAMGASEVSIKLLAGHSTHIQDHYIEKTVEQVRNACRLIAQKYFVNLEKIVIDTKSETR